MLHYKNKTPTTQILNLKSGKMLHAPPHEEAVEISAEDAESLDVQVQVGQGRGAIVETTPATPPTNPVPPVGEDTLDDK